MTKHHWRRERIARDAAARRAAAEPVTVAEPEVAPMRDPYYVPGLGEVEEIELTEHFS